MKKRKVLSVLTSALVMLALMGSSITALAEGNRDTKFIQFNEKNTTEQAEFTGRIDMQRAVDILRTNIEEFKGIPEGSMREMSIKSDDLGFTHVKMQQTFEGIPIFGKEYIVHFDRNGVAYAANGNIEVDITNKVRGIDGTTSAKMVNADEALRIAMEAVNAGELQAEPEIELYYLGVDGVYNKVYRVRVNFLDPKPGDWNVFVAVENGDILNKYNAIAHGDVDVTGTGILGDTKTFRANYSGGEYKLTETKSTGAKVITYDAGNKTWFPKYFLPGSVVTSSDSSFDDSRHPAAVDAHVYASNVFDYFKNKFNRNSIDNNGMDIKSSVHYYVNYVNAFWNGYQMVYGDGDGVQALALSGALDVVAHEITHGVTSHEANLTYQNQSGALNESFSDVFGTLVEFEYQPNKADWLCGEDIWTPGTPGDGLRSMENPTLYNQPDHMDNYYNTSADNGGVHTNSGIPNKAAYLIIDQIGTAKAEKIYYRALTVYLTSSSDFSDCRAALLQACKDYYGQGSEYNVVANAFTSVGIN